jgi:hypothetical protein
MNMSSSMLASKRSGVADLIDEDADLRAHLAKPLVPVRSTSRSASCGLRRRIGRQS